MIRALGGVRSPSMTPRPPLDELKARVSDLLRAPTAGAAAIDLEKNLHALLAAFFDRFELASREDLDVQRKLLERALAKLATLEARLAELEARRS